MDTAEGCNLLLPCKGRAGSVDVAGSCPYPASLTHAEVTWRTPEGVHGPLQLAVKVKAIHCIDLGLQALHLVHQGVHVGIRLPHRDADLQRGQVCPSNSRSAVHQQLHIRARYTASLFTNAIRGLQLIKITEVLCLTPHLPTTADTLNFYLTGSHAGWVAGQSGSTGLIEAPCNGSYAD